MHGQPNTRHTMRFGSTTKVLLKCKLKYYRISECARDPHHRCNISKEGGFPLTLRNGLASRIWLMLPAQVLDCDGRQTWAAW